ncbi:vegetative cell wall protein gp1-like [Salvia divinorum]|uniref:Vegetative cell wall protein gp1-like n=1 Tax=Salvia divinorum TaxID=28513 RepID=A0ABD1H540_SALDI
MVRAMEEGAEDQESSRSSKLGRFRGMLESGASKFRRSLNENNGTVSPLLPSDDDESRIPAPVPLPEDPPPPVQLRPKLGGLLSRTENVKRGGSDAPPASAPAAAPATTPPPAATPPPTPTPAKVAPPPSPPPPVRKKPTGKNSATFLDSLQN